MSDKASDQTSDELTLGELEIHTNTEAGDLKANAALNQRPGRPLTTHEHEVLTDWLNHDSPHASGLRQQLQLGVLAKSSCNCGCGSISLLPTDKASRHRVDISGPYPIEALLTDPTNPGGMILFLKDGLLDDIDVFSFGEQPAQFPSPGEVHFGGRRGESAIVPFDQEQTVLATRLDRLGPEACRSLESSGATSAAFAAVVTVHDEYDRSSGHIGPLRSHLQLFDHGGAHTHPGFLNAASTGELLRLCVESGIPADAWLDAEGPLNDEGDRGCRKDRVRPFTGR